MYIAFDRHAWYLPPFSLLFVAFISSSSAGLPSPLLPLLLPSGFLLFLVCLLFWAMVVVVLLLDLSLGGFSS